jgi:hypothetical protein
MSRINKFIATAPPSQAFNEIVHNRDPFLLTSAKCLALCVHSSVQVVQVQNVAFE